MPPCAGPCQGRWCDVAGRIRLFNFHRKRSATADELDDAHLVQLAIALEGLGDSDRALAVLEQAGRRGTDARGVLAGRLKRRWIAEGRALDYNRALELYSSAYEEAVVNADHAQANYHGINMCFLLSAGSDKTAAVTEMAAKVLEHCGQIAPKDFWCLGTEGEAKLYLRKPEEALMVYRDAVHVNPVPQPWQLKSMHDQACRVATILGYNDVLLKLDQIFRQEPNVA